jgi:hypothetical protein
MGLVEVSVRTIGAADRAFVTTPDRRIGYRRASLRRLDARIPSDPADARMHGFPRRGVGCRAPASVAGAGGSAAAED